MTSEELGAAAFRQLEKKFTGLETFNLIWKTWLVVLLVIP
jgi:hypothetical protein